VNLIKSNSGNPAQGSANTGWEQKNLLTTFPPQRGEILKLLRHAHNWKILSGCWTSESESRVQLNGNEATGYDESMAVIGRRDWSKIELRVRFRFLTNTIRPPDGGAILFFLANNTNNHLAFHYCIGKNSIQLFKKARGVWTILGEQRFEFQLNREYAAMVQTHFGVHECLMEDGTRLKVDDQEISRGCIGIGGKFCNVEFSWLSLSAA
jgi:hypothetical protein